MASKLFRRRGCLDSERCMRSCPHCVSGVEGRSETSLAPKGTHEGGDIRTDGKGGTGRVVKRGEYCTEMGRTARKEMRLGIATKTKKKERRHK